MVWHSPCISGGVLEKKTLRSARGPANDAAISATDELKDPVTAAEAAGLRYASDEEPGIRRRRAGKGFSYAAPDGCAIRHDATLDRIKSLAIPPAWTDVWICQDPRGHLQATGRDARGRKQYRYHPRWREVRDSVKYDRMLAFADALPRIREKTDEHLSLPGLPREKVLAAVVRLLEESLIRIGNDEYARQNRSFGLTTLRDRHVDVIGSRLRFHFRGKSGIQHEVLLTDRRLARIVKQCRDIPGHELFQYYDDDAQRHDVKSEDVNQYLREISGGDFTAKDFRTWEGTVLAARYFRECEPSVTTRELQHQVVQTIERVARELGNTVAVCRKCYVHPQVIESFACGALPPLKHAAPAGTDSPYALTAEERALVALLTTDSASAERGAGRRAA